MTATLPLRADVEQVFGVKNVAMWADVDNDANAGTITARITWAIAEAAREINSRLSNIFAVEDWTTFPELVFSIVVRQAGVNLYRTPRGLVDGDQAQAGMGSIKLEIDAQIIRIIAGQLPLIDATNTPISVPFVNTHKSKILAGSKDDYWNALENIWSVG